MKIILETRRVYLMKIIPETRRTWWRLFQKHVVHTKFDIYVFIAGASSLSLIKDAIATFNKEVACINWIPRKDESDYVRIRSGAG